MKIFPESTDFNKDMFDKDVFIEENVKVFPVRPIKRHCNFFVTNCSVNKCWNKFSTYDLTVELMKAFEENEMIADIGLCSYISQSIVDLMFDAKLKGSSKSDLTPVFGYDFITSKGKIIYAENIWDVLSDYLTVINWNESDDFLELLVEINVK